MARKYCKKAQVSVETAMYRMKRGELKSGKSVKTVKSKEQSVATGLSEARKKELKFHQRKISPFQLFHPLNAIKYKLSKRSLPIEFCCYFGLLNLRRKKENEAFSAAKR